MDSYNQHFALNILHPSARNLSTGGAFQSLLDNFVASKNQLSNNWKLVLIGHKFLCNSLQGLILINLVYNLFGLQQIFEWVMVAKKREKKSGLQNKSRRTGALAEAHHLQKLLVKRKRYFGLWKYLNEAFVGLQVEKLEWVIGLKASIRIVARISKCYFIQHLG